MPIRAARETFLASPLRKDFEAIATSAAFEEACQKALLVFIEEQGVQLDPNCACEAHHQAMGARAALAILRELHLKQEIPKPYQPPQLRPPK